MERLIARFGWVPIMEGDNIIALKRPDGEAGGTVSLEPGGQFELSGAPAADRARDRRGDARAPRASARDRLALEHRLSSASASRPTGRWTRRRACPSSATR
jgi:gamma-glutamylcysteine synthetase